MENKELILIIVVFISFFLIIYTFKCINKNKSLDKTSKVILKIISLYIPLIGLFSIKRMKSK